MARKTIHLRPIKPEYWSTSYDEDPISDFTSIRNDIRSALEPGGNWKVSDIFTWTGSSSSKGIGFVVRDASNTAEWYCITGYNDVSTTVPDCHSYLSGSTNYRQHVCQVGFSGSSGTGSTPFYNAVTWFFNPDYNVSAPNFEFNDSTNLRYTGGDFTSLSSLNPNTLTGLQALRPSHASYGFEVGLYQDSLQPAAWCVTFDDEFGANMVLMTTDSADYRYFAIAGQGHCMNPNDGGDTDETCTWWLLSFNSVSASGDIAYQQAFAFDVTSTLREYDISPTNTLNLANYKISGGPNDGALDWKVVEVNNGSGGSGIKGTFKEQILVEVGLFNDSRFMFRPFEFFDADHPVVRYTESVAVMFERGVRLFPTYYQINP